METTEVTRNYHGRTLPSADAGFVKLVSAVADAAGVDLRTIGSTVQDLASNAKTWADGAVNSFVTIYADAADVGIVAGLTAALVTGANVPSLTAAGKGTLNAPVAGLCMVIKAGTWERFLVTSDRPWLGFIGSGAGYIRIFQDSK